MALIIETLVICLALLLLSFMVLLALPRSMLRSMIIEVLGWIGTLLAAFYILSPIDLIPDFIPFLGQIDDAGALIAGLLSAFTAYSAHKHRMGLSRRLTLKRAEPTDKLLPHHPVEP